MVNPASTPYSQRAGVAQHYAQAAASDLRRHYHLPTFDPARTSGDVMGTLKPLHDEVLRKVKEHAQQMA
jgi:hypothetical protein